MTLEMLPAMRRARAGALLLCPLLDDRNDTMSSLQMTGLGIWDHAANNQ